jgi:hypothetical protein
VKHRVQRGHEGISIVQRENGALRFLVTAINGVPQAMDCLYHTFTLPAAKTSKPSEV